MATTFSQSALRWHRDGAGICDRPQRALAQVGRRFDARELGRLHQRVHERSDFEAALGASAVMILSLVGSSPQEKNRLFVGSEDGAKANTVFVSLLASCAMRRIEPWRHLRDLLCLLPT